MSDDHRKLALLSGDLVHCRRLFSGHRASAPVDGVPPLGLAVESGSLPLVKWLLSRPGVRVDGRDEQGRTPLMRLLISERGEVTDAELCRIAQLLVDRGADVGATDPSGAPLILAAEQYFPAVLPFLVPSKQARPAAPLKRLPGAVAWKGKRFKRILTTGEKLAWGSAAGMGLLALGLWFTPHRVPEVVHTPAPAQWKVHFDNAQQSWGQGEVAKAASQARAAIECEFHLQKDKGEAYCLAMEAYLKQGERQSALTVYNNFREQYVEAAERHDLDARFASYRQQLDRLGERDFASAVAAGQAALEQGNLIAARNSLAQARKLTTQHPVLEVASLSSLESAIRSGEAAAERRLAEQHKKAVARARAKRRAEITEGLAHMLRRPPTEAEISAMEEQEDRLDEVRYPVTFSSTRPRRVRRPAVAPVVQPTYRLYENTGTQIRSTNYNSRRSNRI